MQFIQLYSKWLHKISSNKCPPTELRLDTKLIRAQLGEETKVMYIYRAHQQTMQPDVVVRTPFNLHDQLPN